MRLPGRPYGQLDLFARYPVWLRFEGYGVSLTIARCMHSLDVFEQRLEGAVDGFFARLFRARVHPVELAEAVARYATKHTHVTREGITIPNVFRVRVSEKDYGSLERYGASLSRELAAVVARAAAEERYVLLGPVRVRIVADDTLKQGRFAVTGRHEPVEATATHVEPVSVSDTPDTDPPVDDLSVTQVFTDMPPSLLTVKVVADGRTVSLHANRYTIGRSNTADIMLNDPSVSREHAALVRRAERFWVVDFGSLNGTFVNDRQTGEHPLNPGDRLRFGDAHVEIVGG